MVVRLVDGRSHERLQPVPRRENLREALFSDDATIAVERDPFFHLDAEVAGAGAALLQRFQQLRVSGDPGAAPNQLDRRALIDVNVPPLPPQERRGEEAGHRATDNDSTPITTLGREGPRHRWMLAEPR